MQVGVYRKLALEITHVENVHLQWGGYKGGLGIYYRHQLLWHAQEYWIPSNLARFEEENHHRYVAPYDQDYTPM
jgi:hypothetical protein